MRAFKHKIAGSFSEASELLESSRVEHGTVIAGGTDLLGGLKTGILPDEASPELLIDIKTVPDAAYIREEDGVLAIGALTKLATIAEDEKVRAQAPALAQAAKSVAIPVIRNVATIGGNVCQDVRCWYYRYPHEVGGRFNCMRKCGGTCYAIQGENRYHSVFGGMRTSTSPCKRGCPAGTDIPAYMAAVRAGDWDRAAGIILQANPMPMVTSRICPHPCQDGCNQAEYGESVSIHCVERTVGDYILEHANRFYAQPERESGKSVAIVGAGPGGLSAAYYLRRQGHGVTVYDAHEKAGGVLTYGIPHYRLPKSIVERFVAALEGMGIRFVLGTSVDEALIDELRSANDKLFFSTGAWRQPILGIRGEELTHFGLDFLTEVNTYLKSEVTDEVLVCGGGNVAMDVALTAKRLGVARVTLICLEQWHEMPATEEEIARALEEGVEIHNGQGLKSVVTDESGQVTGMVSMKCTSVRDQSGRFNPQYDEDELRTFDASTIILATGQRVDLDFLGERLGSQLKSARGLYDVDEETQESKVSGIFAGGDAVTGPNIAIRAIAAAGAAARAMNRQLGCASEAAEREGLLTFDVEGVKRKQGAALAERPLGERTLTDEDAASLSLEEAQQESCRCMNCGCYSVNASDISPVLVALGAELVTTKRSIAASEFFTTELKVQDMLEPGELVTEIRVPLLGAWQSSYRKLRVRESVDFAIVSLASAFKVSGGVIEDARLVLGGVAPVPMRLEAVEGLLKGTRVDEDHAEQAAELALEGAFSMAKNDYKLQEIRAIVKQAVLEAA